MRILVTYPVDAEERRVLQAGLTDHDVAFTTIPTESDLRGVHVVFGNAPAALLIGAADLRSLHSPSVGLEAYAPLRAERPEVRISNSRLVMNDAVAEHAIALLLGLTRRLPLLVRAQDGRDWAREQFRHAGHGTVIEGKLVGVLGYGSIAQTLVRKLAGLGAKVIVFRRAGAGDDDAVVRFERLDRLASVAPELAVLCCVLPLVETTHHLVDAAIFDALPVGAYLINVGRGPVVDETALIAALTDGRLGGAGLDVFEEEPLPATSPLWDFDNVVVSPHVGGRFDREGRLHVEQFLEAVGSLTPHLGGGA